MKFKPGQLARTTNARISVPKGTVVFVQKALKAKANPTLVGAIYKVAILGSSRPAVGYLERDLEHLNESR